MNIVDTAGGYPRPPTLLDNGCDGIILYLSDSRPGTNFAGKKITRDIVQMYANAGIDVGFVYQYGKKGSSVGSDTDRGFEGGKEDALKAQEKLASVGAPGAVVYFSVDFDCSLDEWNYTVSEYFRGVNSVLGVDKTGIYGHSRALSWAEEDQVAYFFWQTRAWSNEAKHPFCDLYQDIIDTPSEPGPRIDGIACDINDLYSTVWGQYGFAAQKETNMLDPQITDWLQTGGNNGPRYTTDWIVIHTQEGGKGDALALANYCVGAGVSYNYIVDGIRTALLVNDELAPWAAVEANAVGVHICGAGTYAAWERDKWLETDASDGLSEDAMLWRMARVVAFLADKYDIPLVRVEGIDGWPVDRGVCGHKDFGARGGGHHDPGENFPWDELIRRAQTFYTSQPVVNLIDVAAANAPWLGKRTHEGEYDTRNKDGRWADFEHGHVLWKKGTEKAFAIPKGGLLETWDDYGWETGVLGWPKLEFTKLKDGGVQLFEGGLLYRKDGATKGYFVTGKILQRYAELKFEEGFGYPTTLEVKNQYGSIHQLFEKGSLTFDPTGVAVTLGE